MKTIGYYCSQGFGEFTLPTSGAIQEHGWEPVVTLEDAKQTHADLIAALKPFAKFACSPFGECGCHNCKARDAIARATGAA